MCLELEYDRYVYLFIYLSIHFGIQTLFLVLEGASSESESAIARFFTGNRRLEKRRARNDLYIFFSSRSSSIGLQSLKLWLLEVC